MADLSDDDLMVLFRDGEAEAFDVLFKRHCASVYNYACALLADAEDVMQETFLTVARAVFVW